MHQLTNIPQSDQCSVMPSPAEITEVNATGPCSVAVGGNVTNSIISVGASQEDINELKSEQKEIHAELKEQKKIVENIQIIVMNAVQQNADVMKTYEALLKKIKQQEAS